MDRRIAQAHFSSKAAALSRHSRLGLVIAAATALLCPLTAPPPAVAATAGVTFSYDAAGRLAAVTDASGQSAAYHYDAEGNLLSISYSGAGVRPPVRRSGVPGPVITGVSRWVTREGGTVTIRGHGFSARARADLVRIGPLFAPVLAATATSLRVSAPPGSGGTLSVSTAGGTARGGRVRITGSRSVRFAGPGPDRHPLRAPAGVTALSGLVQSASGRPLPGVRVVIAGGTGQGRVQTTTTASGHFLLARLRPGRHQLIIDGDHVHGGQFGVYAEPVELPRGHTTVLPWVTYLTPMNTSRTVVISSPTTREITVTSPRLPGLEIQIPQGTVIRGYDGQVVHRVSLTPLAVGRTPFPWAPGMVPQYFSLQPGDATVTGPGLRVIYPNHSGQPPGTAIPYLAESAHWPGLGWWRYGTGHVSADGRQIVPAPGTVFHQFIPAGYPVSGAPGVGPPPGGDCYCGDPVNPATGLYVYQDTDLSLPDVDGVILTRTYRQLDDTVRDFGIGMSDSLNQYISVASNGDFDLILPDGGAVPYAPTGTTGRYDSVGTPTVFAGSTLTMGSTDPDGPFTIALRDGTALDFGNPAYLTGVTDRYGNSIVINRAENQFNGGQIKSVVTPDGRWMRFTYSGCVPGSPATTCVTQVEDNSGRTLSYAYDPHGRLITVTGPAGGTTSYTWAPCTSTITCTELLSVTDPDGHTTITNTYSSSTGLVTGQADGDGGTWAYSYTTSQGQVTQATVTNPRGVQATLSFDASGYLSTETDAAGTPSAQTTQTVHDPVTHLLTSETDPLGHTTSYTYDARGNPTSVTELAGTARSSTCSFSYDPAFSRLTSITDPLGHTTTISYDDQARTETVTDALGHRWLIARNDAGQPVSITDPRGHTTYLSYLYDDLVTVTDPLGRATSIYRDSVGRPLQITDPEGNVTSYAWTPLDELQHTTDPLAGVTSYGYDPAGRLTSLTDADENTTTFGYDSRGRLTSQTDPLGATAAYAYDPMGDLTSYTDRNGATSSYAYDPLDRLTKASYGVSGPASQSSTTYSWDPGNRLTKAVDSVAGTYRFSYDGRNDVLSATSPRGKVSYTYDAGGLRTAMTVPGQAEVTYRYDRDNRLTKIAQGSYSVAMGYDADARPTSVTLPDGIKRTTSYDAASEPTAVAFTQGATQTGSLDYGYTADSQISSESGSLAAINLPSPVTSASYNAGNELTSLDGTAYGYDADGNLLSDGTSGYTWNARGQLAAISGSTTASFGYDPFGRPQSTTTNGTTTSFLYDGLNVVQELSGATPTANLLTGGPGQIFQLTTPSGTSSSFLTDTLGSTIALADPAGQIATSYTYDPQGVATASGAPSPNTFEFAGTQNEGTSLYSMGARYYSPSLGHFISQDPTSFNGGTTDLYSYALDDPVDLTDPSGLGLCFSTSGAAGGAAAGGALGGWLGETFAPQILGAIGAIIGVAVGAAVGGVWGTVVGGPAVGAVFAFSTAVSGGQEGFTLGTEFGLTPFGKAVSRSIGAGAGGFLGSLAGGYLGGARGLP